MNKSHSWAKLKFDRLLSKNMGIQFLVLGGFLSVIIVLSYIPFLCLRGDWITFCQSKGVNPWLMPIYLLIDSNALNNLYMGNDSELSTPLICLLFVSCIIFLLGAIAFSGFIIGIITNSIQRRVENHKQGHIHYLKSGHYIIMGWDDMVPSIILHIFEKDKDAYVLLMSAAESENLREKLRKVFDEERLKHIIINYGHRTSADYYNDIHLESANKVYVVGLRTLSSHDAINVECVDSICTYLEQPEITDHPKRITCVFEDLDTYAAFKTSEIFNRVKDLGIEFVPYNFYAGWAKQVFVQQYHTDKDHLGKKISYPTLFGKGYNTDDENALTADDPRYVHLVFVGTTNFAVAFAMEAAQVLHFPNGNKHKTLITFIDKNADVEKDEFIVRNRHFFEVQSYYYCDLSNGSSYTSKEKYLVEERLDVSEQEFKHRDFLDVEFEFIKGDVFSKQVQSLVNNWANEHNEKQYLSVFLAMANQRQNFVLGMNMPDSVYDNEVPIFIRQDRSDNFVSNLRETDEAIRADKSKNTYYVVKDNKMVPKELGGRYSNIYPFGMNETAYSTDDISLARAKLINYLYNTMTPEGKFQSVLVLSALSDEQIWKEADEFWKKGLTVALKWSNLYNAYTIPVKLAILRSLRGLSIGDKSRDMDTITDTEAEILARVEHNRWNVEKLLMGFRKAHRNEDKYEYPGNKEYQNKLKLNKKRFIHHDIRPYDDLDAIKELDIEFSRYIPWILKMTEGK
ncbi:MAG: hypothetical protein NC116_09590 [Clostridium sp.]|nr:hypothetical protein [Clostridium sp.]